MNQLKDKNTYRFQKYCQIERWASYWYQINEILNLNPKSVLEVGIGDKVVGNYLKNNTDIIYKCVDISKELNPDIVSSVDNLGVGESSYELVCAFEVLEHLPFEKFKQSLKELYRVSQKYVVISLPHWGRHFSFTIRLPFIKRISWQCKINLFPIKHEFRGEHYWEIGKKGFSLRKTKRIIESVGFRQLKDYVIFESPYHHIFVLRKK